MGGIGGMAGISGISDIGGIHVIGGIDGMSVTSGAVALIESSTEINENQSKSIKVIKNI